MKTKRYWLRGGLIGGFVIFILQISYWILISILNKCFLMLGEEYNVGGPNCGLGLSINTLPPIWMIIVGYLIGWLVIYVIPLLIGFIIGAIIGWFYGRIKK